MPSSPTAAPTWSTPSTPTPAEGSRRRSRCRSMPPVSSSTVSSTVLSTTSSTVAGDTERRRVDDRADGPDHVAGVPRRPRRRRRRRRRRPRSPRPTPRRRRRSAGLQPPRASGDFSRAMAVELRRPVANVRISAPTRHRERSRIAFPIRPGSDATRWRPTRSRPSRRSGAHLVPDSGRIAPRTGACGRLSGPDVSAARSA